MRKCIFMIAVMFVFLVGLHCVWAENTPMEKMYLDLQGLVKDYNSGIDLAEKREFYRLSEQDQVYTVRVLMITKEEGDTYLEELEGMGVTGMVTIGPRVYGTVPVNILENIAEKPWVVHIMSAPRGYPTGEVTTEAFSSVLAEEYHAKGYKGQGVRIAILDEGFKDIENETPNVPPERRINCESGKCYEGTVDSDNHGTACSEIVYDFAPDAEYYWVQPDYNLVGALQYLQNKVDIISMSLGWHAWNGPLDGRDILGLNEAIKLYAYDNGTLFIKSAGNEAEKTYVDSFNPNSEGYHVFPDGEDYIKIRIDFRSGSEFYVGLTWDEEWDKNNVNHPIADDNYDLELYDNIWPFSLEAKARFQQDGDDFPYEWLRFNTPDLLWATYRLKIKKEWTDKNNNGIEAKKIRLILAGCRFCNFLDYDGNRPQNKSSLSLPADSKHALTVGAVGWGGTLEREDYSSRGPTTDGRIKPDVMGFANVKTAIDSSFGGTSAATPHVAGMAAVLMSAYPFLTVHDFIPEPGNPENGILHQHAIPRESQPNNKYGWGIATLPPLGEPLIRILTPTTLRPANVRANHDDQKLTLKVRVESQSGGFIPGLDKDDFSVSVASGFPAPINYVLPMRDSDGDDVYLLNVTLPKIMEGEYDLLVVAGNIMDRESSAIIYGTSDRTNIDSMLVIDRSGSMSGGPLANAKNGAKLFVDRMNGNDQVGVASYNTSSYINFPLTVIDPAHPETTKEQAKTAISNINSSGGTDIGDGLRDGYDELTTKGDSTHPWSIVLLTDGLGSIGTALDDIEQTKIRVFTIGLGSVDKNLLGEIAQKTGGQYFYTPAAQDIQYIYDLISGYVLQQEVLFTEQTNIRQNMTQYIINKGKPQIDSSVTEATFSITWTSPDNHINLTLKTPSGQEITPASPGVIYQEGDTYASYTIAHPEPGNWVMIIYGADVRTSLLKFRQQALAEGNSEILDDLTAEDIAQLEIRQEDEPEETVTARIVGNTTLNMDVYTDRPNYTTGQDIHILTGLVDNQIFDDR